MKYSAQAMSVVNKRLDVLTTIGGRSPTWNDRYRNRDDRFLCRFGGCREHWRQRWTSRRRDC